MRIRIRIQQLKLMRIHADPDPKPCLELFGQVEKGGQVLRTHLHLTPVHEVYHGLQVPQLHLQKQCSIRTGGSMVTKVPYLFYLASMVRVALYFKNIKPEP
jgi:hypothetical protein